MGDVIEIREVREVIEIREGETTVITIETMERGLPGPPGSGGGGSVPSVTTTGTSTAYVATPGLTSMAGLVVLRLHTANGANPTITLDGFAAAPLKLKGGAVPPSGSLTALQPLLCEVSASAVTILNEV